MAIPDPGRLLPRQVKPTKEIPLPYARHLKQQVTIRLGTEAVHYFKSLSEETGVPYQNLINSYLMDCMLQKKKPHFVWK